MYTIFPTECKFGQINNDIGPGIIPYLVYYLKTLTYWQRYYLFESPSTHIYNDVDNFNKSFAH